eukprot:CAMPEP_0172171182 /NCGR_PEP_ID=MMETSP1050-20130122/11746_1 /TAXON_ID=233186 /ORGANISM="Cryptomonas curvata, Strain CCAP979/52" /LENGTH=209 /DNA_ID=CAMNT_0012842577 /DNA_START=579 /DNA_END=1208 /DNA_ORIENTATION=+
MVFETPSFVDYFRACTPEQELKILNIGSRPSMRKAGGIESLRAIPWMFAWTQTRMHVPVWFGVGTALRREMDAGRLEELKRMYASWPFFQSTLELVEAVLAKVDVTIGKLYEDLLVPEALRGPIGGRIWAEHALTVDCVTKITGRESLLGNNPVLKRMFDLRRPIVDTLNLLQARLLKDMRGTGAASADVEEAFASTVQGIANGMGWTG